MKKSNRSTSYTVGGLTPADRIKVYKRALKTYKAEVADLLRDKRPFCSGMCKHIDIAAVDLGFPHALAAHHASSWPEYHTFRPKKGWKRNPSYWWSTTMSRKGYERRIAVLTALAEGKVKGE